jgi:RNA polymerase sigma factor (sigma-70 family)
VRPTYARKPIGVCRTEARKGFFPSRGDPTLRSSFREVVSRVPFFRSVKNKRRNERVLGNNRVEAKPSGPKGSDVPSSPVIEVVKHLRKTILWPEVDCLSDGRLLDRYLAMRDDAAFAALVRRHGPMVWGVCRRILGHAHDAEDAFQAAFIILVRKAGAIKPREAVGNWLYGVACHTALKARTACTRVRAKEKQVTSMPEPAKDSRDNREELQMLLDQELSALPDKYRLPVVLCDLEGRTRKEVAAQLKIPEGTLSSRLATAHQVLAKRLARHGLAVSGGSLAALFAQNAESACVPAAVVSSTIKTATLVAASNGAVAGVVSTKVAVLTEGVMKAMLLTKLKIATAVLLVVALIGVGADVGTLTEKVLAARQPEKPGADAPKTPPGKEADKPKTDHDRLQGTWEFVSYTHGGKTTTKKDLGDKDGQPATLIFDGDKTLTEVSNIGGKSVEYKGTYKIDPSQKPKEIDLTVERGEKNFGTSSGIYEVEGDALRLCWPGEPTDLDRPTKLESKEGESYHLMTYKRVAKKLPGKEGDKPKTDQDQAALRKQDKRLKLEGPVTSVLWSPDGKFMAVVATRQEKAKNGDKERPFDLFTSVRIHDAKTGKENVSLGELKNANQVHRMFSPDGKTLAISIRTTIQAGDKVELWDAEKGELLRTIEMEYGRAPPRLAFSPDGKQLAVTFGGRTSDKVSGGARVFDTQTGDLIHSFTGHKSLAYSVCFSPDGKTLATGGDSLDREIYLWNLPADKANRLVEPGILEGLKGSAWCVTFSPDGKTLAGSDTEGGVRLWDVATGKEKAALPDNAGYCSLVAFTRNGRLLLGVGRVEQDGKKSGEVRVWDLKTNKLLLKLENTSESAAFSPDDRTLSVLVRGEGIRMVNLAGLQTDPPIKEQPKDKKPEDLATHIKKLGRLPAELTKAKKSDAEIVDALFRASLNRGPVDAERAAVTKLLDGAKDRTQKSRDILWALVNSHEFLKLHNLDGNITKSLRLLNELSTDWDQKTDEKKLDQKKSD